MKKVFGPGLLFAATAIGVSHLVQSTRAGADFGWSFAIIILLSNLIKFPFFEFGTRYAHGSGESLISGYFKLGKWAVWIYSIATILSMFTVTGAVSLVTAGMMVHVFGLQLSIEWVTTILFLVCMLWLAIGRFKLLDSSIKVITAILTITSIVAFGETAQRTGLHLNWDMPDLSDRSVWVFTIALIGWMPTAVDLSVWNSIWTVEKQKTTGEKGRLKDVLLDFNIGYWLSAVMALIFLGLGAMLMYQRDLVFPSSAVGFTGKLIELYTLSLGEGSYYIIAIAAFAAMFSTTLSVFDGYGRTMVEVSEVILPKRRVGYWLAILIVAIGGWLLISFYGSRMTELVELAMIISFVLSPIVALLNTILVNSKHVPITHVPPAWLKIWAKVGLVLTLLLSVVFGIVSIW